MKYIIKTKSGDDFRISQTARDNLTELLLRGRDSRPQFVEISEIKIVINTDSISVIDRSNEREPDRLPTREEDLAEFNARWDRDHKK